MDFYNKELNDLVLNDAEKKSVLEKIGDDKEEFLSIVKDISKLDIKFNELKDSMLEKEMLIMSRTYDKKREIEALQLELDMLEEKIKKEINYEDTLRKERDAFVASLQKQVMVGNILRRNDIGKLFNIYVEEKTNIKVDKFILNFS
jgi:vacuolar-type H+-ATPase subunit I/STV1